MRLPLRHAPPESDSAYQRCAHLEALVEASVGLPLAPAARMLSSQRSRGRHGNALQWHLGLEGHDGCAALDWEDRIEIKLVSVWRRGRGANARVVCDKLKVCDLGVDPWHKLSNVMWVFADRLTRVVVGAAQSTLRGPMRQRLAKAWNCDPHFGHPALFVEAREQAGRSAPAYYLSAKWFEQETLLPTATRGIFPFDTKWWSAARAVHRRDPWMTVVEGSCASVPCPRCGGPLSFEREFLNRERWAPARHGMPGSADCLGRDHAVVLGSWLEPSAAVDTEQFRAGVEARVKPSDVWRLADMVSEPADHLHGF